MVDVNLINLTPHPLRFYREDTPDRISDVGDGLLFTLEPSGEVARLTETEPAPGGGANWETYINGVVSVPVERVGFTSVHGLPAPTDGVRYVVPLVTAIAVHAEAPGRDDLLVPYSQVRNAEGTVVGCRTLAQPC